MEFNQKLVKENFRFLAEEYGFEYAGYDKLKGKHHFVSNKVNIQVQLGHRSPSVFVHRIGEPDFLNLLLERFLQYLGKAEIFKNVDYTMQPLEKNVEFVVKVFRHYAPKIINDIDEWWLPAQKFQYELMLEYFKKDGQLDGFLIGYKQYYDYLKSRGAIE